MSFKKAQKKSQLCSLNLMNLGVLEGGDPVIGDITTFTGYENRIVSYLIEELPKQLYTLTCDCNPQQIVVWCLKSVTEYAFLGL